MGIATTVKGRLAVKEQGSSWGTAETSFSATDFIEVIGPIVPPMPRETLGVDVYRPGNTASPKLAGVKRGQISFTIELHGHSATTPSTDPAIFPDATILKNILGGGGTDAYSTAVAAGSTTSLINFTNGTADAAWSGFAQLAAGATKNVIWWAKTVDVSASPDTIVPLVTTIAEAPAAGTAYGSYVVWQNTAEPTPLTIDWLGTDATAHIRYYDAVPISAVITGTAKQLVKMEVTFDFLNWTNVGSGGAPADYAYTYPKIPAFVGENGARALFSGGSSICPTQFVLTITQTVEPADCASSDQGTGSLKYIDRKSTIAITRNPTDYSATPWTDSPGTTTNALQIDVSNVVGRAMSICMPAPQNANAPAPTANGSLLGVTNTYEPLPYTGDTGSTAPADTELRIAFL